MRDGKKSILIVDDMEMNRHMMESILEEEYSVSMAENGKAALDYLKNNKEQTDLVITDIVMPVIDGFELLKLMKVSKLMKTIPVLIITAVDERDNEKKAMEYGAEDIIMRPFNELVLKSRIRNILEANHEPNYKNVMEEIVETEIENCINALNMCKCEKCRRDLAALTLNHLKPKYVSSERGRLYSNVDRLSYDYLAMVVSAIAECAEIVKKYPRHADKAPEKENDKEKSRQTG